MTLQLPEWDVALEKIRALERETVGERLRRLRLEAGLAQRDLERPGRATPHQPGRERQRRPSTKALRLIAPALGVTVDELEFGPRGIKDNPTFRSMRVGSLRSAGEPPLLRSSSGERRARTPAQQRERLHGGTPRAGP